MDAILVFKTKDHYIKIMDEKLEYIDYLCFSECRTDEKLRERFASLIKDEDGEFKILIDPQSIPLLEFQYHTQIEEFNHVAEIDVRHDINGKKDIIKKLSSLMNSSTKVLRGIYDRHQSNLDNHDKVMCLIGFSKGNINLQLSILGSFIEKRFKDESSYLFLRELYGECFRIRQEELENKNKHKL